MSVFKRPGSDKWQLRFFYDGKIRVVSSKTSSKRLAQKQLDIIKAEIAQGKFKLLGKTDRFTVAEYSERLLEWVRIHRKYNSYVRYQVSLKQLLPFFGNTKLRKISREQIERYKRHRIEHAAGTTINRDLAFLKKLCNMAIADGYLDTNPVKGVEFFKENLHAFNFLSEEEAKKLVTACTDLSIQLFVVLGLNTGMRTQEMLSLKWENVNPEDRTIVLMDTKKGGDDTIPMNETVYDLLNKAAHISEYVICKPDGTKYKDVRKLWGRVLKTSGIKRCTPHILRHTFATTLVRAGADLRAVMVLGRWSSLKLVERYAHVGKDHRKDSIALLDGRFQGDTKGDTVTKNDQN